MLIKELLIKETVELFLDYPGNQIALGNIHVLVPILFQLLIV